MFTLVAVQLGIQGEGGTCLATAIQWSSTCEVQPHLWEGVEKAHDIGVVQHLQGWHGQQAMHLVNTLEVLQPVHAPGSATWPKTVYRSTAAAAAWHAVKWCA